MLEQKALSKYVDEDLNFVKKFLTEKAFVIDGIFTMHPKEVLDFWETVANKENPNSASAAVIFYVALYKTLPEMIRRSYSKNVNRIRRTLNTLLVFTIITYIYAVIPFECVFFWLFIQQPDLNTIEIRKYNRFINKGLHQIQKDKVLEKRELQEDGSHPADNGQPTHPADQGETVQRPQKPSKKLKRD